MKKIIFTIMMMIVFSTVSYSQAVDSVDTGYWNDIVVTKAINKKVDVVAGMRFDTKSNASRFAEQRLYAGLNLKRGNFTFSPMIIQIRNFSKVPYFETRLQATLGYKFLLPNKFTLNTGVRLEYHVKQNLKDDGRVVPLISLEKKLNAKYALFAREEFWIPVNNNKDVAKNRSRSFFGVTRTVNKNLAVDIFYLLQLDQQVNPKYSHKLGFTWKFKF